MRRKVVVMLFLLLAVLSCTAWAAGDEPVEEHEEVNLFQCGSLDGAQTIPGEVGLLSSEAAYQCIYQGLLAKQEKIDVSEFQISRAEIPALYEQVVNDNPELFYVGSNVTWWLIGSTVVSIEPYYLENLPADAEVRMNQAIAEALSLVEPGMSQAETALVLHDYLMDTVAYDWDTLVNGTPTDKAVYSAYGALVNGKAVCNGYALAYQMLLKQAGINAVKLTSTPMNHAWNLVEIDGNWYHVDVTHDDPAPNVEGGGRHFYFLRSDESMNRVWDTTSITCPNDYIEGWWLNNTSQPVHRWNGAYYYLGGYQEIYRTETLGEDPGVPVVSGLDRDRSSSNGVRWVDGQLYYTSMASRESYRLNRCDLATGARATVGEFSFAPTSSADGLGLRCNREAGVIEIYSDLQPELGPLYTFAVRSYPAAWDSLPLNADTLAGCVSGSDGILRVGLVWTHSAEEGAYLAAAFYRDGRMVKVQVVDSDGWETGLNVLELDTAGRPAYDRVALFLLSDSGVPLCASKTAA